MATGTIGASSSAARVLTAKRRMNRAALGQQARQAIDDDEADLGQQALEDAGGQAEEQRVADDPPGRAGDEPPASTERAERARSVEHDGLRPEGPADRDEDRQHEHRRQGEERPEGERTTAVASGARPTAGRRGP